MAGKSGNYRALQVAGTARCERSNAPALDLRSHVEARARAPTAGSIYLHPRSRIGQLPPARHLRNLQTALPTIQALPDNRGCSRTQTQARPPLTAANCRYRTEPGLRKCFLTAHIRARLQYRPAPNDAD